MPRRATAYLTLAACAAGLATLASATPFAAAAAPAGGDLSRFATGDLARLDFSHAGTPAPDTAFEAKGGKTLSLADFKGKVVVLNLWATWCAPCVTEMPTLDTLQSLFPAQDLAVVTVSMDMAGWRAVEPFWQKRGLRNIAPYLDKKNQLALGYKARGLPLTVIYDRSGKEIARIAGPAEWHAKPATDLIAAVVGSKPGAGKK